jgi:hypothetical protein
MKTKNLPLKQLSIAEIYNGEKAIYEVPIYQRNYAWEKDEIAALIQDVYDAYFSNKEAYYIGTLVSFHKGDQVYEVIDGQQRLTTINLVLKALGIPLQNKLTYRARKKSNETIQSIPDFQIDEKDKGIVQGFKYVIEAIEDKVDSKKLESYKKYFLQNVFLVHYQVPKDIDLNHYFEIMNSRGEQLEKHEIIKVRLIEKLNDVDKLKFNRLWEACSEMNVYIQQKHRDDNIFGKNLNQFLISNFDELSQVNHKLDSSKIIDLINFNIEEKHQTSSEKTDTFQPVIDFTNFLLIVLKITRLKEKDFNPGDFTLDDKELIKEFDGVTIDEVFAKEFGFNLLKAKYFLDNYIVHHSDEEDRLESNPWKLQQWFNNGKNEYLKNLDEKVQEDKENYQNKLVQILSMFEVSFTARQRKNYLFYVLTYLFSNNNFEIKDYYDFLSKLAKKYLKDVYLMPSKLNQINTPNPRAFDETILINNELNVEVYNENFNFNSIYGDGTSESKGIPLYIFNYLDYLLWNKYDDKLRAKKTKEGDSERSIFFEKIGCSDFDLRIFEQFYFSRTRRSLEHFYPTANAKGTNGSLNQSQINCFGNYAMIGSDINSSGSNYTPKGKLVLYLDPSGKVKQVSVASLKFMIMMQTCKDNESKQNNGIGRKPEQEWNFEDIMDHQSKMVEILIG